MTGRKSEGSRSRVVAEGMLQIELVAHLADEGDRMLARSKGPTDGQVGDEPAVVGADMQTVLGCHKIEVEVRRAQQRLSRREAGSQRMLGNPPQGAGMSGGGLTSEV